MSYLLTSYFHYTYKVELENGKYYVGRHSTKKLDDNYVGSGKWVSSLKDKSKLKKTILNFFNTYEELLDAEETLLKENIEQENCMNFNNSPVGFAYGALNYNSSPERKLEMSKKFKGEGNPMYNSKHSKETLEKMSKAMMGDKNPSKRPDVREKISKRVSEARTGLKYSEEGKRKLSEKRKREWQAGKRHMSFKGRKHSEESKIKCSEARKKWWQRKKEQGENI